MKHFVREIPSTRVKPARKGQVCVCVCVCGLAMAPLGWRVVAMVMLLIASAGEGMALSEAEVDAACESAGLSKKGCRKQGIETVLRNGTPELPHCLEADPAALPPECRNRTYSIAEVRTRILLCFCLSWVDPFAVSRPDRQTRKKYKMQNNHRTFSQMNSCQM